MRAQIIRSWVKVGRNLHHLKNYQSLKAVVSALGTPPIARLKRTWAVIDKKTLLLFNTLRELMSEESNFAAYRSEIRQVVGSKQPNVPFLGPYIHDTTYLIALAKKEGVDPKSDMRVKDIFMDIHQLQAVPRYSFLDLEKVQQGTGGSTTLPFQRQRQWGLSSRAGPELQSLRELDADEMAAFIQHWILTRGMKTEKEMDQLSLEREPRPQSNMPTTEPQVVGAGSVGPANGNGQQGLLNPVGDYIAPSSMILEPMISFSEQTSAEPMMGEPRKRASAGAFMDALKASFVTKKEKDARRTSVGELERQGSGGDISPAHSGSPPSSDSEWSLNSVEMDNSAAEKRKVEKRRSTGGVIRDLISFGSPPASPPVERRERDPERGKGAWLPAFRRISFP
ncbi:hypothetical protein HDV00_003682 [Rhizophlyctis rosea]|nr:hypothetical protein HDV00_003682 [Rhizophlyctis rosea]